MYVSACISTMKYRLFAVHRVYSLFIHLFIYFPFEVCIFLLFISNVQHFLYAKKFSAINQLRDLYIYIFAVHKDVEKINNSLSTTHIHARTLKEKEFMRLELSQEKTP